MKKFSLVLIFSLVVTMIAPLGVFGDDIATLRDDFANGNLAQTEERVDAGGGTRPDLVRQVPTGWSVMGPVSGTNGFVQGDVDNLWGNSKPSGANIDAFYTSIDLATQKFKYSGSVNPVPKNPNSADDEQNVMFFESYTPNGMNVWSSPMNVSENTTYKIEVDYLTGGLFTPGVRFFDENGNVFRYAAPVTYSSDTKDDSANARLAYPYTNYFNYGQTPANKEKWLTYSNEFIAPKGATTMRVAFTWKDTGTGINGKYLVDNIRVYEVTQTPLDIINPTMNNGTDGYIAKDGTTIEVVAPSSIADGSIVSPIMRDDKVLSISAGGTVETEFIDAYGAGKYFVKFDASTDNLADYQYSVEYFDYDYNQLDSQGTVVTAYSSLIDTLNRKTITGNGALQTTELTSYTQTVKDINFNAPKNTAYFKIYFVAPETTSLLIDNLTAEYKPTIENVKIGNVKFVDENGDRVFNLNGTTATSIKGKVSFLNYGDAVVTPFIGGLALYEKETNKLAGLNFTTISPDSSNFATFETTGITLPESPENYYLKFITFNNLAQLVSFSDNTYILR